MSDTSYYGLYDPLAASAGLQPQDEAPTTRITVRPEDANNLNPPAPEGPGMGRVVNRLLGINGEERYQTWPERMVRSGFTLPHDVMTGQEPTTAVDPISGETVPAPHMLERTQDLAGMAMSGGLAGTGERGMVVGSGPVRNAPMTEKPIAEKGPIWHSPVENALEQSTTGSAPGKQWLATLQNARGVKPEELEWTGLRDFLTEHADDKITRQELHEHMARNKVQLQDVERGGQHFDFDKVHDANQERAIDEVRRRYPGIDEESDKFYERVMNRAGELTEAAQNAALKSGATKYHDYQLPGGENYREHLLTLPTQARKLDVTVKPMDDGRGWITYVNGHRTGGMGNPPGMQLTEEQALQIARQSSRDTATQYHDPKDTYRSSHWDEPNIVAHVRTNDRMMPATPTPEETTALKAHEEVQPKLEALRQQQAGVAREIQSTVKPLEKARVDRIREDIKSRKISGADGMRQLEEFHEHPEIVPLQKKLEDLRHQEDAVRTGLPQKPEPRSVKTLHIEEVQSDWHQAGRKQGYGPPKIVEGKQDFAPGADSYGKSGFKIEGTNNWYETRREAEDAARTYAKGVPDAPFKTTWPELAMRRMVRRAAEEGYDRISWTPGEAQAARYDLSKQVSTVVYKDGNLTAIGPTGQHVINNVAVPKEKLTDYIGKEAAEKLIKQEPHNGAHTLQGEQLKVGGEGMREFYDKMLPRVAEKIGKAHGVKVQKGGMDVSGGKALNSRDHSGLFEDGVAQVHYFDIPQSLKDQALQKGMPLFSGGKMFIPATQPQRRDDK